MRFAPYALLLSILLLACSSSDDSPSSSSGTGGTGGSSGTTSSGNAGSSGTTAHIDATKIAIEIDYQSGAEPFTGTQPVLGDPWQLFKTNAAKLFEGSGKTIDVPTTLDAMEKLDDITGTTFDVPAILAIAERHRATKTAGDTVAYYFLWLDGRYAENGEEKSGVLGVSIGNTGVIAMFKPVIESSGPVLFKELDAAVEQTVLVHEFGHAVGLVNNGVALTSQHQDTEHGAHCTNPECVMYWTVEGAEAARAYVRRRVTGGSEILFAEDCLADIRAAK